MEKEKNRERVMMSGSEAEYDAEQEQRNIPRLPLFNTPPMVMHSPERPGMTTPPLYTSASVPFGWEEEPGKPRPCASLVSFTTPSKCLEIPPRLLLLDGDDDDDDANKLSKWSKLPSPNTVLEGPYVCSNSHQSPSFRILSKGEGIKEKMWFGSWRGKSIKVRREVSGGNDVFPSSAADRDTDDDHVGVNGVSHKKVRTTKMKRSGSFYNRFQAKFLATINKGLKQVVPWRSIKLKKDGCGSLRL